MIYSSAELKIISGGDQDKKLNDDGDMPVLNSGRATFGSNLQEISSDDSLLSNLEVSLAINFIATTYWVFNANPARNFYDVIIATSVI